MKTFIVSEIASNWEGNLEKAKKLISESKKSGANAVKFQMWRANDLYKETHPDWKIIKKSELSFDYVEKLKKFADNIGIEFSLANLDIYYEKSLVFYNKIYFI